MSASLPIKSREPNHDYSSEVPSHDDLEGLLLSCRYGDLEDVQMFVQRFGWKSVEEVRDENGNTVLHMCAGNGHLGHIMTRCLCELHICACTLSEALMLHVLDYILPNISPSLLAVGNSHGSTPLHWASLNAHLPLAQAIVLFPQGPGVSLIDIKNKRGYSALTEAELSGVEGKDDVARWLVKVMRVDEQVLKELDDNGPGDEDLPTVNHGIEKGSESLEVDAVAHMKE